jgi:hypothetical protein
MWVESEGSLHMYMGENMTILAEQYNSYQQGIKIPV